MPELRTERRSAGSVEPAARMRAQGPSLARRPPQDQAATLRRLFARTRPRLLPVLMPEQHCTLRSAWIARLVQAHARLGERTLVIDAARAQIAAALGLRARFDLAQAWCGDCEPASALVDAGPNLAIVPAARALQFAQDERTSLAGRIAADAALLDAHGGCDLALLLLPSTAPWPAARLPRGDVLVPVVPTAAALAASLRAIERLHALAGAGKEGDPSATAAERGTTPAFRLLFLGMAAGAAATLAQRLSSRGRRAPRAPALQSAGAVRVARDLDAVVRASCGWALAALEPTD